MSVIIKDLQQLARERACRCAKEVVSQFRNAILPIYADYQNNVSHLGTCTLIEIDGVKMMVTAAHVIDHHKNASLHTGSSGKMVPIEGEFHLTTAPGEKRSQDHYDFSVCPLAPEFAVQLTGATYIGRDNISAGRRAEGDRSIYLAVGYPNSRNKGINIGKGVIDVGLWNYTSSRKQNKDMSETWERASTDHIFIDFDSKHARDCHEQSYFRVIPAV